MKIAFYVSRNATRLKKFLMLINKSFKKLVPSIDFVLTDNTEDIELKKICLKIGIDFYSFSNKEVESKNLFSSNYVLGMLNERSSDYLIIYCDRILKGALLQQYHMRIINFHPSVLPAHKGLFAIDQARANKTLILGNTAHFVDEGIDTGPTIMQSLVTHFKSMDYDDVLDLQIPMMIQLFAWINEERIIIVDGYVKIKNANYEIGTFVPNLEFHQMADSSTKCNFD